MSNGIDPNDSPAKAQIDDPPAERAKDFAESAARGIGDVRVRLKRRPHAAGLIEALLDALGRRDALAGPVHGHAREIFPELGVVGSHEGLGDARTETKVEIGIKIRRGVPVARGRQSTRAGSAGRFVRKV